MGLSWILVLLEAESLFFLLLSFTLLGLGFGDPLLDLKTESLTSALFFSRRALAKTAVRHLSPRGGGGDRQLSDACHPPGLFSIFFTRLGLGFQSELDRTLCYSSISF